MAFKLQNDDGTIDGANAYISVVGFKAYHDDRGNSYGAAADADIEKAIIKATDYLDLRFRFRGYREREEQRTQWPRLDAIDDDDILRDGIPEEVVEACADYALLALTAELNPNPTRDGTGQRVTSSSSGVGPIQKAATFGGFEMPRYPKADRKLLGLIVSGRDILRA